MAWDYEFTASGPFDVFVTLSGQSSYEELRDGRRRMLDDPRFRPGLNVLVDNSHLDTTNATADTLRAIASSAAREYGDAGVAHVVMLAPQTVTYGLLRMWHTFLSDEFAGKACVVSSLDEAHDWLASRLNASQPKG